MRPTLDKDARASSARLSSPDLSFPDFSFLDFSFLDLNSQSSGLPATTAIRPAKPWRFRRSGDRYLRWVCAMPPPPVPAPPVFGPVTKILDGRLRPSAALPWCVRRFRRG